MIAFWNNRCMPLLAKYLACLNSDLNFLKFLFTIFAFFLWRAPFGQLAQEIFGGGRTLLLPIMSLIHKTKPQTKQKSKPSSGVAKQEKQVLGENLITWNSLNNQGEFSECIICTEIELGCACMHAQSLSCVRLFATPWTVAHQAPLSMGFSRQE